MKNSYVKAALVTLLVGVVVVGLFYKWRENSAPVVSAARLSLLDQMELQGLPAIEMPDFFGKSFRLADHQGKIVIVNFWATWCAPCIEEIPSLISLVNNFKGKIHLVAISGDSTKEEIDVFLKSFPGFKNENITLIWDEKMALAGAYGVEKLPESFVSDTGLKLKKKIVGSIPWHTPESEEFVKDLLNEKPKDQ